MIAKFSDGKKLEFEKGSEIRDIIGSFGIERNDIIAVCINGELMDLSHKLEIDVEINPIVISETKGLEILRHSAAHLLAHAVTELFPGVQVTLGPAIEDGFFHDFYYPPGFVEADLKRIEKKMHELVKKNYPIIKYIKNRREAIAFFADRGENYKVMMIEEITEDQISFYSQGSFTNACRGPHVPSTGYLKAFKLTKLSGAYWKGDSKNEMLQRIYGTAWATEDDLKCYLDKLERAKLSDHRILGKKMDLFHLQEEAPGMVFWHPNGWTIYSEIKKYLSTQLAKFGYQEVNTPQIIDRALWEKSGHWDNYKSSMFITEAEKRIYAIKPMNCPGHIQIFKQGIKSYRDLPIRYSEFGCCHRNEVSGALHGIIRVRSFTQDDGHILCTEDQIANEAYRYIKQAIEVLVDFGFGPERVSVKLSTRPRERIGTDIIWDKAEKALGEVLDKSEIKWEISPGEGAFYGPKIEFMLRDALDRIWQTGTLQIDFFMPERLGAYYISESGQKKYPVMLHRAMLGSLERFIGILLEETAGNLPLWLAPVQAVVTAITDEYLDYAQKVTEELKDLGYRVICDSRNEKVSFKIREHSIAKVHFIILVGEREVETGTISVRKLNGDNLGQISVEKLVTEVMMSNLKNKV